MTLTFTDLALLSLIVSVPVTVLGVIVHGVAAKHVELERRLLDVEESMVERKEWLREMMHGRERLDSLCESVAQLGAKLDNTISVGAAINRLAGALERRSHG